jgi:acetolactate synthase-1/2/3 large subunit
MDSIPMVILTAQVPTSLIGDDAFQEVDTFGITRPCVKHNYLVRDVKDLATTIKKAFFIANSGRPGPVVVDIPKDVTANKTEYLYPKTVQIRSYAPVKKGHSKQISRAAKLLLSAKRPIIYSGGGIILSGAAGELTALVDLLGYPCTNTLMGLGGLASDHPQFLGMLGMHGTYEANMAMYECDVMLAVGARFDDRVTGDLKKFSPHARIIHIDIDPASIGKNVRVEIPIVGDASVVLEQLVNAIRESADQPDAESLGKWWEQIKQWQSRDSLGFETSTEVIKPQFVVQKLHEITGGDAFVTSDVGQHQMWAAQYYGFSNPRRWINSGGLGTMGFGLPAAIGVQLAHPEATVACVTGEASIMMCIQELSTCKQYDLPLKIVNLNNRYMGMVRQWQEFFYEGRYSHSYMDSLPDFVELAASFGHVGVKIEDPADVEDALREAIATTDKLVFLDFITDQAENVYPMIAAGAGHNQMVLKPSADGSKPPERELA